MSEDRLKAGLLSYPEVDEIVQRVLGFSAEEAPIKAIHSDRKYQIPDRAAVKAVIAKDLVKRVHKKWTLFDPSDWDVWPSGEVPGLIDRVRKSQGHSELFVEKSSEIVGPEDADYLTCLVAVALYGSWNVLLVDLESGNAVFCSHDNFMTALGPSDSFRDEMSELMEFHGQQFFGWKVDENEPLNSKVSRLWYRFKSKFKR